MEWYYSDYIQTCSDSYHDINITPVINNGTLSNFTVKSGTLPTNLELNSSTGVISGRINFSVLNTFCIDQTYTISALYNGIEVTATIYIYLHYFFFDYNFIQQTNGKDTLNYDCHYNTSYYIYAYYRNGDLSNITATISNYDNNVVTNFYINPTKNISFDVVENPVNSSYSFTLTLTDKQGFQIVKHFTGNLYPRPIIKYNNNYIFKLGETINITPSELSYYASGTTSIYATGLPTGLKINPSTGEITGSINTSGIYNIVVNLEAKLNNRHYYCDGNNTSCNLQINIVNPVLTYANTYVPTNTNFTINPTTITDDERVTSRTFTITPNTLSIDSNGNITGNISSVTTTNVTVTMTENILNKSFTVTNNFTITTENPITSLAYNDDSRFFINNSTPASKSPTINSDATNVKYIIEGTLPDGITSNDQGVISGTPTSGPSQQYTLTITAYNNVSSKTITYTFKVGYRVRQSWPVNYFTNDKCYLSVGTEYDIVCKITGDWTGAKWNIVPDGFTSYTEVITENNQDVLYLHLKGTPPSKNLEGIVADYHISGYNSSGYQGRTFYYLNPITGLKYYSKNSNNSKSYVGTSTRFFFNTFSTIYPEITPENASQTITYNIDNLVNLPTGVNFDSSSGIISGTATSRQNKSIQITACNSVSEAICSFQIRSGIRAYLIDNSKATGDIYLSTSSESDIGFYVGGDYSRTTWKNINTNETIIINGSSPSPINFPYIDGLQACVTSLGNSEYFVSLDGTPTTVNSSGTVISYLYESLNGLGGDMYAFTAYVYDPITTFTYNSVSFRAWVDTGFHIVPTYDGTNVSFSADIALPPGLTLNTSNGRIDGKATGPSDVYNINITAVNKVSSLVYYIQIRVGYRVNYSYEGDLIPNVETYYLSTSNHYTFTVKFTGDYNYNCKWEQNSNSSFPSNLTTYNTEEEDKSAYYIHLTGTPTNPSTNPIRTSWFQDGFNQERKYITFYVYDPIESISLPLPNSIIVNNTLNVTAETSGTNPTWSWSGLPAGITANGNTISGTPTTPGNYTITVTASNLVSSYSQSYSLSVISPVSLSYDNLYEYYINDSITSQNTAITPVTTGIINAFEKVSGTLPTGLSLNTSTGKIYGTPTTSGNYTITVKAKYDDNNYDTFEFTISIKPTPTITYNTITCHINTPFYVTPTLTNTNNPTIRLLIQTTELEVIDSKTGKLYCNLATGGEDYDMTLELKDTIKNSTKTIITPTIKIYTKYLPTINYSNTNVATNNSFTVTPTKSNTNTTTWTVSPSSLSINSSGVVSGKYTTSGSRSVSVTLTDKVTNTTVSVTDSFYIYVYDPITTFTYPSSSYTFVKGVAITNISPTYNGTGTFTFTSNKTLPTGLSLNTSTGTISGTPTATNSETTYTITARNQVSSKTFNITITIKDPITSFSYSKSTYYYNIDESPTVNIVPSYNSGITPTFTINKTLPTGLSLNTSTGTITGTPTTITSDQYTITANAYGTTKTFTITIVTFKNPTVTYPSETVLYQGQNFANTITPTITNGHNNQSFTCSNLPSFIELNESTGVLTCNVLESTTAQDYNITIKYSETLPDENLFEINISLKVIINLVNFSYDDRLLNTNGESSSRIFENVSPVNPSNIHYYEVIGSLPKGLNINNYTGKITGEVFMSDFPNNKIDTTIQIKGRCNVSYTENGVTKTGKIYITRSFKFYLNFLRLVYGNTSNYVLHGDSTYFNFSTARGYYNSVNATVTSGPDQSKLQTLINTNFNSSTLSLYGITIPSTITQGTYTIVVTIKDNTVNNIEQRASLMLVVYNKPTITYTPIKQTTTSETFSVNNYLQPTITNKSSIRSFSLNTNIYNRLSIDSDGNITGTLQYSDVSSGNKRINQNITVNIVTPGRTLTTTVNIYVNFIYFEYISNDAESPIVSGEYHNTDNVTWLAQNIRGYITKAEIINEHPEYITATLLDNYDLNFILSATKQADNYYFTVKFSDDKGLSFSKEIEIRVFNKPSLSYSNKTLWLNDPNVNITPSYTLSKNDSTKSFTITNLPSGLTYNTSTGAITGTAKPTGTHVVNAIMNSPLNDKHQCENNSVSDSLQIIINSAISKFSYPQNEYKIIVNQNITDYITNGIQIKECDGTETTYSATNLPTGLSINTSTGIITGKSTTVGTYETVISATAHYQTLTYTINFEVIETPDFSYNDYCVNETTSYPGVLISPANKVNISSYSLKEGQTLPTGLSLDTTNGDISGTINYNNINKYIDTYITIIGHPVVGNDIEREIYIYINFLYISYNPWQNYIYHGEETTINISILRGYYSNAYIDIQTSPSTTAKTNMYNLLNSVFDKSKCLYNTTIPNTISAGLYKIYTYITDTDDNGTSYNKNDYCNIYVYAIPTINYSNKTFYQSSSVSITPTITGSNSVTFTYSGTLPSGLSFDTTTGKITGTISSSATSGNYNITVSMTDSVGYSGNNNTKTVNDSFTITVKTFSISYGSTYTYAATATISTISPTVVGDVNKYEITSGTLPTGLSFNTSNGYITGTISSSATAKTYTVTITATTSDGLASKSATLSIIVKSLPTITYPSTIYCCKTFDYKKITPTVSKDSSYITYTTSSTIPKGITRNGSSFTGIALTTGDYTVNLSCKYYSANISKSITLKCVDILEDIGGWIVNLNCPFKFKLNCDWPITSASIYNTEGLITIDTNGYITCVNGFNKICAIYPVIELQVTDPLGVSHKLIKYLTISVRCNGSTNFNYFANTNRYKYKLNKDICIEPIHTVSDIFDNFEGTNYQLLTEDENLDLSVNSNGVITGSASKVGDYEVYVRWYNNNGEYMDARIYLVIHTIDIYSLQHNIYRPIDFRNSFIKITK